MIWGGGGGGGSYYNYIVRFDSGGALEFSVTGLCPSKNFSSPNEGIFRVNRHPIGEFFIGSDTQ